MKKCKYFEPSSILEATQILREYGSEARPIAGGTDLLLDVQNGRIGHCHLVDIGKIGELNFIVDDDAEVRIGATTTHHQINSSAIIKKDWMMLFEAAGCIGSRQIRNLATIGGNVCNALPCADSIPALVAAGAEVVVVGKEKHRRVPVSDFIVGPRETILKEDELVTEFVLPHGHPYFGSTYLIHTTRKALDLTIVGVATYIELDNHCEKIQQIRIALGNCSPRPMRAQEAEIVLNGESMADNLIEEAADIAAGEAQVRDSVLRASAKYRKELVRVLTKRSIHQAYDRALGKASGVMRVG